jgi:hypothetical protein
MLDSEERSKQQFWITVEEYGTVLQTSDEIKAEEKFALWCSVVAEGPGKKHEVILFSQRDGEGAVIWKRQ